MQNRDCSILIKNINIYDAGSGILQLNTVLIENGKWKIGDSFTDLTNLDSIVDNCIDAKGNYTLIPEGMLDAHVHGQGGPDFADVGNAPDKIPVITKALGETGLSYVMATLVSLKLHTLKKCLKEIERYIHSENVNPTPGLSKIVGVHLEGPFIAKNCKGAHQLETLQESIDSEKFMDIIAVAPSIKEWKITLAPELPGAIDFIKMTKKLESDGIYVKVFIGHTNPNNKEYIDQAIQAGAVGFTHLGNACQESCCRLSRDLNPTDAISHVVQWVLENPTQCPPGVELIVDGVHVSKSFVTLVRETIGEKIVLVTDALGPSGLPDGPGYVGECHVTHNNEGYKLGDLPLYKEKTNFYLRDEKGKILLKGGVLSNGEMGMVPALAGSAAPLSFCIKKYCDWVLKQDDVLENAINTIYTAAIKNPKITSLSKNAINTLPEAKNFVIFDGGGQLAASLCNGVYIPCQDYFKVYRYNKSSPLSTLHLHAHREKTEEGEFVPEINSMKFFSA